MHVNWVLCIYACSELSYRCSFDPSRTLLLPPVLLTFFSHSSSCFGECVCVQCAHIYQNTNMNYARINTKTMLTSFIYAVYVSFWIIYVNMAQIECENCAATHYAFHILNGFRLKPDAFVFDLGLPGNSMFKN